MFRSDGVSFYRIKAAALLLSGGLAVSHGCAMGNRPTIQDPCDPQQASSMVKVQVLIEILSSRYSYVHDDFQDGSWLTTYSTKAKIISPDEYRGLELTISHGHSPPPVDSLWTAKGRQLRVDIEEFALKCPQLPMPVDLINVHEDGVGADR